MMKRIAGLIVARGGSKSIPRKNLQLLAGRPMIAYSFEAALESGVLDRVILSTDNDEIADVGRQWGVEVPFMRPAELSGDEVHVMRVTEHALQWLEINEGYAPDYFLLLQPTSPLRNARDIREAVGIALAHDADAVVSVTPAPSHPYLMKTIDACGRMQQFIETNQAESRRQELPPAYSLNGAIYLVRRTVLLATQTWCPDRAYAYVMPPERSMDVDGPWDLHLLRLVCNDRKAMEKARRSISQGERRAIAGARLAPCVEV